MWKPCSQRWAVCTALWCDKGENTIGSAASSFTNGLWRLEGEDSSVVNYVYWHEGENWASLVVREDAQILHCVEFSVFAADPLFLKVIPYFFSPISVFDFLFKLCTLKTSHCNIRHCFVSFEENILQDGETHQPWLRSKLLKQGRGYSLGNSVEKKKDTIEILKEYWTK